MNLKFVAFGLAISLLTTGASADGIVDGSAENGKTKAVTCSACHGADGNSVNPEWPSIAGQHASYLVKQLQAFKSGSRTDTLMSGQSMMLSEQDMNDLSVYFSEQRAASRAVPDADLVARGEALYRGGDRESSATACIACHGPTGTGNPAAAYPSIHGQYATYTAKQLRDYASGARKSDGVTRIMRDIASRLSENDIKAVSAYIQGLRGSIVAAD